MSFKELLYIIFFLCVYTGVGKSYLMSQFLRKKFEPVHEVTVGAEFGVCILTPHDKIIKLHIWDTVRFFSF